MTDTRLREREREAGLDPIARVRWLTERMRAGSLTRERVELAAYCGDEAARAAVPPESCVDVYDAVRLHDSGALVFETWVAGLSRWRDGRQPGGACVLVRAMVAAVRAGDPDEDWSAGSPVRQSVERAEAWLRGDLHPDNFERLPASSHGIGIRAPGYYLAEALWQIQCGSINAAQLLDYEVENCVRVVGEQPVREAICSSLISWSLA